MIDKTFALDTRRDEQLEKPENSYGLAWQTLNRYVKAACAIMEQNIEKLPEHTQAAIRAALNVLPISLEREKSTYIQGDIHRLFQKNLVDQEVMNSQLAMIKQAYDLSDAEFTDQIDWYTKNKDHYNQYGTYNPEECYMRMGTAYFKIRPLMQVKINLNTLDSSVSFRFEGPFDGGIDSLAYPIDALDVSIDKEGQIETQLYYSMPQGGMLDHELKRHPEVNEFSTKKLAEILLLYAQNPSDFYEYRHGRKGDEDPTTFYRDLMGFLTSEYIPAKLPTEKGWELRETLEFVRSPNIRAVSTMWALGHTVLSTEGEYSPISWYEKNCPDLVAAARETTLEIFQDLGLRIGENGELHNLNELIQKARTNASLALTAISRYGKMFRDLIDKFRNGGMLKYEIEKHEHQHTLQLQGEILTRALVQTRGGDINQLQLEES